MKTKTGGTTILSKDELDGENFMMGQTLRWWLKVHMVMELFGAKDSDDLARMLRGRGNPWEKDPNA